jgi:hypothetical protein
MGGYQDGFSRNRTGLWNNLTQDRVTLSWKKETDLRDAQYVGNFLIT